MKCRYVTKRTGLIEYACQACGHKAYSAAPAGDLHHSCRRGGPCRYEAQKVGLFECACLHCGHIAVTQQPRLLDRDCPTSRKKNTKAAIAPPPPPVQRDSTKPDTQVAAERMGITAGDVFRYVKALARWTAAGLPERSQNEVERLLAICLACAKYRDGRCLECTCRVNDGPAVTNKIRMATEHCPLGKWAAPSAPPWPGPTISVVMPTYNQAKFLREAIDSILAQTFRDFELIIVNDGSNDDTEAVVKSYADPRIKYTKKPNGGTGSALNEGFRHASGKYETWWASDNVLRPEAFQSLVAFLDGHPGVDYVYANCEIHTMDYTGMRCVSAKNVKDSLGNTGQAWDHLRLSHHYFLGVVWLWRRVLRERVGQFSEANGAEYLCEDYDFTLRASEVGRFAFLDRNLGWYRRHAESHSAAIAREVDPHGPYSRVIRRTRVRRFPRKAWFYWGEKTLPYLRYLTLASFRKFNPDWQVTLYRPPSPQSRKVWVSQDQAYAISGRDYSQEVAALGVRQETADFKALGIDPALTDVHRSDLLRLHLLATQGGVWSDMDIMYFAPLNFPWYRDTYLCPGPYGHSIGLLASTPDNPVFRFLLDQARKALARGDRGYQSAGASLFNRHAAELARLDANHSKYYALIDRAIFHIPMETVYAYDAMHIPAIHEPDGDGGAKFTAQSIGCHWYGGHALAGRSQNTITADNWLQLTSVLGEAIRRALA